MSETKKLCGNCSGDHKLVDCPIIDLQFAPTKVEYNKLKETAAFASNWKQFLNDNPMILREYPEFNQIVLRLKDKIQKYDNKITNGSKNYLDSYIKEILEKILKEPKP